MSKTIPNFDDKLLATPRGGSDSSPSMPSDSESPARISKKKGEYPPILDEVKYDTERTNTEHSPSGKLIEEYKAFVECDLRENIQPGYACTDLLH